MEIKPSSPLAPSQNPKLQKTRKNKDSFRFNLSWKYLTGLNVRGISSESIGGWATLKSCSLWDRSSCDLFFQSTGKHEIVTYISLEKTYCIYWVLLSKIDILFFWFHFFFFPLQRVLNYFIKCQDYSITCIVLIIFHTCLLQLLNSYQSFHRFSLLLKTLRVHVQLGSSKNHVLSSPVKNV